MSKFRVYDKLVLSGREFDDELHKEIVDCVNEKSQLRKMEEEAYRFAPMFGCGIRSNTVSI